MVSVVSTTTSASKLTRVTRRAPVAQGIEHPPPKRGAGSSILPGRATIRRRSPLQHVLQHAEDDEHSDANKDAQQEPEVADEPHPCDEYRAACGQDRDRRRSLRPCVERASDA